MHIYPIRNTRNYWNIPIYCCHDCSIKCKTRIVVTEEGNIDIVQNPLYDILTKKCNKYDTLRKGTIPLKSFNFQIPFGIEGRLYYPDLVVIPDLSFSMCLTFPFMRSIEISITCEQPITLRELIELIKTIYIQIYEDEEKTADTTIFTITQPCVCIDVDLKEEIVKHIIETPDNLHSDCSICYTPLEKDIVKLPCQHIYHTPCILGWIDKGNGMNCPLCRYAIHPCQQCNGERLVTTDEEFVVLPVHLREVTMNRNNTNGIYGIYSYDLEQLYLTEMQYNRVLKILQIDINY